MWVNSSSSVTRRTGHATPAAAVRRGRTSRRATTWLSHGEHARECRTQLQPWHPMVDDGKHFSGGVRMRLCRLRHVHHLGRWQPRAPCGTGHSFVVSNSVGFRSRLDHRFANSKSKVRGQATSASPRNVLVLRRLRPLHPAPRPGTDRVTGAAIARVAAGDSLTTGAYRAQTSVAVRNGACLPRSGRRSLGLR